MRRPVASFATTIALMCVVAAPADAAVVVASPYVVAMRSGTTEAVADAVVARVGLKVTDHYHGANAGVALRMTPAQAAAMAVQPEVEFIEQDGPVSAAGKPSGGSAPSELIPPGIQRIGGTIGGAPRRAAGVAVAVVDTGIAQTTELNVRPGKNCVTIGAAPTDNNGHGTNVAGIIGARANGSATVGAAPDTPLYSVKVLDARGSGTLSQLLCGLDWIAANAGGLNIRVVNLSLAAPGSDDGVCGANNADALHRAICSLTAAGLVVIAAAGNKTEGLEKTVPAAYGESLAVTAMSDTDGLAGARGGKPTCTKTDADDRYATLSNYATTAAAQARTIAAPGMCVVSTGLTSATSAYSGTSQAAPHVAAAAALCINDGGVPGPCDGLTPSGVVERLRLDAVSGIEGFLGDPMQPVAGRFYGPLLHAR